MLNFDYIKCTCGNFVFKKIDTAVYNYNNFQVYTMGSDIQVAVKCAQIIECISCGRYQLPGVNLSGKSPQDPEFIAYSQLINAVRNYNSIIDNSIKNLDIIQKNINHIIECKARVSILEDCIKIKNAITDIGTLGASETTRSKRGPKSKNVDI